MEDERPSGGNHFAPTGTRLLRVARNRCRLIGCSASLVGGGSDKMLLQTSYNRYKMLGWMHVFFNTKSSAAFSPQLAFSNAPVMQRMQCPMMHCPTTEEKCQNVGTFFIEIAFVGCTITNFYLSFGRGLFIISVIKWMFCCPTSNVLISRQ